MPLRKENTVKCGSERTLTIEQIVKEFSKQPWCKGRNPFVVLSSLVESTSLRLLSGKNGISADPYYVASMLRQAALSSIVTDRKTGEVSIRRNNSNEPLIAYHDDQQKLKPLSLFDAEIRLNAIRRAMEVEGLILPPPWVQLKPEHRRKGGRKRDPLLMKIVTKAVQSLIKERGRAPHVAVVKRLKIWTSNINSTQNAHTLKIQGLVELYSDGETLVAVDVDKEHSLSFRTLERYTKEASFKLTHSTFS